ncbi:ferrous iron transport protein B [Candidatus Aminicenantes bacterium AC-334-K16]|nr:ferrous iron transport protein B [Candidatus Aminicenantes bacterium AC-334-K16]
MTRNKFPDIIFIGQPNCGKSTLFNAIAGLKAETSNFPGTTVKHTHSRVNILGHILNIIDLPGLYSLAPGDEAEKVALSHLFYEKPDLIINVVDASSLGRNLELTLELIEMGLPMVVALNMMDLAEKKGIKIDVARLEKELGVPVVPTVAPHGRGLKELLEKAVFTLLNQVRPRPLTWSKDVEDAVYQLEKSIPADFPVVANRRFTAIKMIEMGSQYFYKVLAEINLPLKKALDEVKRCLEETHNAPAYEVVAAERHHLALKIFESCTQVSRPTKRPFLHKIDDLIMHPYLGYLVLLIVFLGFFFIVFSIGSPLEELILGPFEQLRGLLFQKLGYGLLANLIDGLLQGIGGGMGIVLPYFIPLLFMMALLEDVGYLARVGFLMDIFMHRLGLHGKSISPFILGFGCNVPAIVSTRILESRRDKIITTLLIPFIPCSARTTIILALVAFYLGPLWALGFYVFHLLLIAVLGRFLSMFFKEPSPGLILEIPDLKVPSLKNIARKTFFQLRSFINFAWPILIAGSVILAVLQSIGADRVINMLLSPLVVEGLGLPQELGVTLIFGFLRKELSLIMMIQALGIDYQQLLSVITPAQIVIFTLFVSLFIPCLSTVAMIWKEVGRKIALISVALNLSVAITLSLLARIVFDLLGGI